MGPTIPRPIPRRRAAAVLLVLATVVGVVVVLDGPADTARASIVSEDPAFAAVAAGTDTSGSLRTGNVTFGPWAVEGRWGFVPANGSHQGGLVLHPWPVDRPSDARPATVAQTVRLPADDRIWLRVRARNGARILGVPYRECADSGVTVRVDPSEGRSVTERFAVTAEPRTVTLDISRLAGQEVRIEVEARAVDDGCGPWNAEFTVLSMIAVGTGDPEQAMASVPARGNRSAGLGFYAAPPSGSYPEPDHPPEFYHSIARPPGSELKRDYCQKHDGWAQTVVPTVTVCTNSDGLRDREYAVEKPEDVYRIIALGDAVTFGTGVNNSETWPNVLERRLNGRAWTDELPAERFQVLNFGFPAWNTAREVTIFSWKGIRYDPDLVILQYMENDAQNLSEVDRLREKYFRQLREKISDRHKARVLASRTAFREEREQRRNMTLEEEMEFVVKHLDRLDRIAEEEGFKVMVMYYSTAFSERHRDYLQELVRDRYGWAFMETDLAEVDGYGPEDYLLDQEDFYLNAQGYNLTTRQVMDYLERNRRLLRR